MPSANDAPSADGAPGLRVAVVGPTHPFKGGVAAHTTETAHRLAAEGHDVDLVSWSRLYPARLYPGEQTVPGGGPDLPPFPGARQVLRWDRPWTWWRAGAGLRGVDVVVLVLVVPFHVPALVTLIRAARRRRGGTPPRFVLIAHNVQPHESHPGAGWLVRRLLRAVDMVVAHSVGQAELARAMGAAHVRVADLPPHLPGGVPSGKERAAAVQARRQRAAAGGPVRVLALGIVREYKGIDLLLAAAERVPDVAVTVAGELWGTAGERVRTLAADPALHGRVRLAAGYVPGDQVPELLAGHDLLALPYRHATASQNVLLAHAHGLPVLATAVGTFGEQVRDGVDGVVVAPGDVEALVVGLRRVTEPAVLTALVDGVPEPELDGAWQRYLDALLAPGGAA